MSRRPPTSTPFPTDALPISPRELLRSIREELGQIFLERDELIDGALVALLAAQHVLVIGPPGTAKSMLADRKSTRLNSSHTVISYAVFCLKKKNIACKWYHS